MRFNLIKKAVNLRFIIFTAIAIILAISIIAGAVYYYQGASLSGGTFNNTLYNATGQYVHLNFTDATNTSYVTQGNYTSSVIDLGGTTGFVEIKWRGNGSCPANMSYIDKFGGYCIDQYEASKPDATNASAGTNTSMATSKAGVLPWASFSQTSAITACANAGKHLCSSLEWLGAANILGKVYYLPADLSINPYNCNTNSLCTPCVTKNSANCRSKENVYDLVGNVWEWVNETITSIAPGGSSAYYYPNSTGGFQASTGASTLKYGNDGVYFLSGTNAGRAVLRGGGWDIGADAGLFCAFLGDAPSYTYTSIGFRCCSGPS